MIYGGLGVTAGAHRYWAHKCFKANILLRIFLMTAFVSTGEVIKIAQYSMKFLNTSVQIVLEYTLRMGQGSSSASQVVRYGRRSLQLQTWSFLFPRRLAHGQKTSRITEKGQINRHE